MPVTTLDARTALVVIDLQKGLLGYPTLRPMTGSTADVLALLAARGA